MYVVCYLARVTSALSKYLTPQHEFFKNLITVYLWNKFSQGFATKIVCLFLVSLMRPSHPTPIKFLMTLSIHFSVLFSDV